MSMKLGFVITSEQGLLCVFWRQLDSFPKEVDEDLCLFPADSLDPPWRNQDFLARPPVPRIDDHIANRPSLIVDDEIANMADLAVLGVYVVSANRGGAAQAGIPRLSTRID